MLNFTCLNLLVSDLDRSREFYTQVFGEEPVSGSPHYVCWHLPSGVEFGLVKAEIAPRAELVFETDETETLPVPFDELNDAPPPCRDRRFGRTLFLAEINGHRIRLQHGRGLPSSAAKPNRAFVA